MEVPPTRQFALLILSASFSYKKGFEKSYGQKKSQELKPHKNIRNQINDTPYKGLETIPSEYIDDMTFHWLSS